MLKNNNIYTGLSLGILVPFLAFGFQWILFGRLESAHLASGEGMALNFKTRTICMIALCANALLVGAYQKRRANETVRGVAIMTVILAFVWFIYYGYEILE